MTKFQLLRNWLIYVIFLITTLVGTTWLNVAYAWEGVVIHHSATSPNTKAESIKRYHVEERGWDDIGYHWIIEADGRIVQGRSESTVGAHALNPKPSRNQTHIGICVIGNDQFSAKQYLALRGLLREICTRYGNLIIDKHHEACPGQGFEWAKLTLGDL